MTPQLTNTQRFHNFPSYKSTSYLTSSLTYLAYLVYNHTHGKASPRISSSLHSTCSVRVQRMHNMLEPARNPDSGDSSLLQRIDGKLRSPTQAARYLAVEKQLADADLYSKTVFLNPLAPTARHLRYSFMHEFAMPFAVELYSYSGGGVRGTLWWVWKVPPDPGDSNNSLSTKLIASINANLQLYHTRAMRKEFVERYSLITKLSHSVLNKMYQHLTNDASALPTARSQRVQQRLLLYGPGRSRVGGTGVG